MDNVVTGETNPLQIGLEETEKLMKKMSPEEREVFGIMFELAMMGVTPEDYAHFYQIFDMAGQVAESMYPADDMSDEDLPWNDDLYREPVTADKYEPLADASAHTLVLKVQMKDVQKPPMWREIEIPADYNFLQLHYAIQEVTGLKNCHLWQFNEKAYNHSLVIGAGEDSAMDMGLEDFTHEARETPVTTFLQRKGDKLEYVYDFGDDWIFTIEVKDLLDKKSEHPVCRKYKSDLNAIEDFGGVWSYLDAREEMKEWETLTKKKREEIAWSHNFESPGDYIKFLHKNCIDIEAVNASLAGI